MTARALAAVGLFLLGAVGRADAVCVGDCNGDGKVTIDELLRGVRISLGELPIDPCPALDCTGSGTVTISCLVQGVNNALEGCPLEPVAFTAALDEQGPALLITPATALRGELVYAVVLTGGIADTAGQPLQASPAFAALEGAAGTTGAGPVALFESDVEAAGNPYPDGRLVQAGGVQ